MEGFSYFASLLLPRGRYFDGCVNVVAHFFDCVIA